MKALQITKDHQSTIVTIPEPSCAETEVLVRMRRVGLCGSDLATYLGKNSLVRYPRIPGHEIAGIVERCGSAVPESIRQGSGVTVLPYTSCGTCTACLRGRYNACRYNQTLGVQRDGALTELIAVPWQKIVRSEHLASNEMVFVEPLSVGFHAIERGIVTDSDTVLVIGCGMIGLGAIAGAHLRGARVFASDIDPKKLKIAADFGASHTINSLSPGLHESLQNLTKEGPDVVVEAVGNPATYRAAIEEVAFAGRVVCIGYAPSDASLSTRTFVQKELDVRGSRNATATDFASVVDALENRAIPTHKAVSLLVPLDQAGDAFLRWADAPERYTKILISVSES
jgi:threonine dehydrogenase-like Zn-dependent dehydrogenase